jgi:hypothetical protein
MSGWLIDTNVISALRTAPSRDAVAVWFNRQPQDDLHLSAVCLMEMRFGAELAGGAKGRDLAEWIDAFVDTWFGAATLPVGDETLLVWRRLLHRLRKAGKTIGEPDSLIAATALEHGLIVVSRDTKAFSSCDVPVLNHWTLDFTPPGRATRRLSTGSLAEALRGLRRTR